MAVRYHDRLPLSLRSSHDWSGVACCHHADPGISSQGCRVGWLVTVLRQAVPDQLRHGGCDRNCSGVPVRDELEQLLYIRWQYIRSSFGYRRPVSLFHGVDLLGSVDFRP